MFTQLVAECGPLAQRGRPAASSRRAAASGSPDRRSHRASGDRAARDTRPASRAAARGTCARRPDRRRAAADRCGRRRCSGSSPRCRSTSVNSGCADGLQVVRGGVVAARAERREETVGAVLHVGVGGDAARRPREAARQDACRRRPPRRRPRARPSTAFMNICARLGPERHVRGRAQLLGRRLRHVGRDAVERHAVAGEDERRHAEALALERARP